MSDQVIDEPLTIGTHTMRNRIFVSAHTVNFAENHRVSQRHLDYHERRAAGGVGLIITEGLRIHPTSLKRPESLSVWTDDCLPGLTRLVQVVHAQGALLFGQILHSGREAADGYPRTPSWGPSPIPWARGAAIPHEMDELDIAELVACFAAGARRVVDAGFDGLEVHLGHGHLLQQFLSPVTNARTDAYGGSPQRRRRIVDEVLEAVRAEVPSSVAMGIRISGDEFMSGGLTADEMAPLAASLVGDHSLDFVNVSHSAYVGGPSLATQMADMAYPATPFRSVPRAIKDALPGVPVLAAGRVDSLADAEHMVSAGDADAVAMTRAHIANPLLIVESRTGAPGRRCVSCNQLCIGRTAEGLPMSCVVNPEVGLEATWARLYADIDAAVELRPRILVVGAGPAGLEAAATAARWAQVTVAEKRGVVGGSAAVAAGVGSRSKWSHLVEDQLAACHARGVSIELDQEVDLDGDDADGWDAVVVAVGAVHRDRTPPGQAPYVSIIEAARDREDIAGGRHVVFDDVGGWPAWSWVEHLLDHGAEVHYVSPLSSLAPQITVYTRLGLLDRLKGTGRLVVHLMRSIQSWDGQTVSLSSEFGATIDVADVDRVHDLGSAAARDVRRRPGDVLIGDAYAPRDIGWAVFSGRRGGLSALVRSGAIDDARVRSDLEHRLQALPLLGT
jgi:dimethylglycine catabolism A